MNWRIGATIEKAGMPKEAKEKATSELEQAEDDVADVC